MAKAVKERETKAEAAKTEAKATETKTGRTYNNFPRVQMQVYVMNQPERGNYGLRYTGGGTAILKLRCNIQPDLKERTQNPEAQPIWYTLEVWGETAEAVAHWQELGLLEPGATLLVAGLLKSHNWQGEGGQRQDLVLKADEVALVAKGAREAE